MSKATQLKELYQMIKLHSTEARELLSKVKNGDAVDSEINQLFDIIRAEEGGGKILDDIKNYEDTLVVDVNNIFKSLNKLEEEYLDVAHEDDEIEKERKFAAMKTQYEKMRDEAQEIIEAMEVAYFQIKDFDKYANELYVIKENLGHWE